MNAKQCDCCEECLPLSEVLDIGINVPTKLDDLGEQIYSGWEIDVCKGCLEKHSALELLKKSCTGLKI